MVVGTPASGGGAGARMGEGEGGSYRRVSGWLKVAEEEEARVGCILAMG